MEFSTFASISRGLQDASRLMHLVLPYGDEEIGLQSNCQSTSHNCHSVITTTMPLHLYEVIQKLSFDVGFSVRLLVCVFSISVSMVYTKFDIFLEKDSVILVRVLFFK